MSTESENEFGNVVYDDSLSINDIVELDRQNRRILCPVCRSEMLVALSRAKANEARVHQGVYCSIDKAHFSMLIEVALPEDYWEKFKKK